MASCVDKCRGCGESYANLASRADEIVLARNFRRLEQGKAAAGVHAMAFIQQHVDSCPEYQARQQAYMEKKRKRAQAEAKEAEEGVEGTAEPPTKRKKAMPKSKTALKTTSDITGVARRAPAGTMAFDSVEGGLGEQSGAEDEPNRSPEERPKASRSTEPAGEAEVNVLPESDISKPAIADTASVLEETAPTDADAEAVEPGLSGESQTAEAGPAVSTTVFTRSTGGRALENGITDSSEGPAVSTSHPDPATSTTAVPAQAAAPNPLPTPLPSAAPSEPTDCGLVLQSLRVQPIGSASGSCRSFSTCNDTHLCFSDGWSWLWFGVWVSDV